MECARGTAGTVRSRFWCRGKSLREFALHWMHLSLPMLGEIAARLSKPHNPVDRLTGPTQQAADEQRYLGDFHHRHASPGQTQLSLQFIEDALRAIDFDGEVSIVLSHAKYLFSASP